MRHLRLILIPLIVCSVLLSGHSFAWTSPDLRTEAKPRSLLVKLKPGISLAARDAIVRGIGGRVVGRLSGIDVHVIELSLPQSGNALQAQVNALAILQSDPRVEYAEPDLIYRIMNEPTPAATTTRVVLPLITALLPWFTPNDPGLSRQYAWERIDAFAGWGITRGSNKVVIAVIDTGVQASHPDLKGKLVGGYDFVDDDTNPDDGNGHGTHVAGIAAAATNNGVGVAGTCPNCLIMPVRVLDDSGSGSLSDVAAGIIHAADNNAKVINLSLGGLEGNRTLADSVQYAWNKGSFLACAAGNFDYGFNSNFISYPAAYSSCFAVASTNKHDSLSDFSNYGSWINIAAPGSEIHSTWDNSGYESLSGTSMATPYVSGVAGLLVSQGLTNKQITERLCGTADAISGTGTYWECGRLNMYRAVTGR